MYTKYIDLQQGYNNLTYLEGYTTKRGGKRERDRQARARIHGAHTQRRHATQHTQLREHAPLQKKEKPLPTSGAENIRLLVLSSRVELFHDRLFRTNCYWGGGPRSFSVRSREEPPHTHNTHTVVEIDNGPNVPTSEPIKRLINASSLHYETPFSGQMKRIALLYIPS